MIVQGELRKGAIGRELWEHALEWSVLLGLCALLASWLLPPQFPVWTVTAALSAITGITIVITLLAAKSMALAVYFGAWGVALAVWLNLARMMGPWHAWVITSLLIIVIILAPAGALVIARYRDETNRSPDPEEAMRRELRRWVSFFEIHGVPGVQVLAVIENENGTGRQVIGRLGKAAQGRRMTTFDQLRQLGPEIATSRRLAPDAVWFTEGDTAADFTMHLRERRGPREIVHLPLENRYMSVNHPIPLGITENGRPWELLAREVSIMIVGVKGSGKSNLINVFIAQMSRCVDTVIFMIDLKGGRAARPWMMPWVKKFTRRPVIDWLATTRAEAEIMLRAVLRAGQNRARRAAGGWEKIEPTHDLPQIILIVDETAVMTGHNIRDGGISNAKLAQLLAEINETFRSEAIVPVMAALRANVDIMGSTAVKAMSEVRFGMKVSQASDGQMIFPDNVAAAAQLARLRNKGDCLVMYGTEMSPPVHIYRIEEKAIEAIALWAGNETACEPEDQMIEAMGDAYAHRWTRPHGQDLLKAWRNSAGMPEPVDDDTEFGRIVASMTDVEAEVDPRHARLRQLLARRGAQGYTVKVLVRRLSSEGLTTPRGTVHRWLSEDGSMGMVRSTGPPFNRWVWQLRTEDDIPVL